jgi:hypothetical protein
MNRGSRQRLIRPLLQQFSLVRPGYEGGIERAGVDRRNKEVVMKRVHILSMLVGVAILITACGGGGGGIGTQPGDGSGTQTGAITYTGLTTPAPLSAANVNVIFALMWNAGTLSGDISLAPVVSKSASFGNPTAGVKESLPRLLKERLSSDVSSFAGGTKRIKSATPVNETYNGSASGTRTINGSIDSSTGTGTLTLAYANFNDGDGNTYDGSVTVWIDGYDWITDIMTDWTMICTSWTIKSTGNNVTLSGSIRVQERMQSNSETMTVNMVGRDNIGNDSFRFENYVETTVYDNLLYPSSASETYVGRVYVGKFGYVDISTVSPCIYANPNSDPGSGGPIILAGAGSTKAAITPISNSYVKIEVDNNGDGVYENKNTFAWSNLSGPAFVSIIVTPTNPSIAKGTTQQFTATATFSDNSTQDLTNSVTWTSADESIAEISSHDGSYSFCWNPGCAYGWNVGSATITAALANISGSTTMQVTPAALMSLEVGASPWGVNPVIAIGMTRQFTAIGTFSDGSRQDVTASVTWSSSNTEIAKVSNTTGSQGMANSIASGTSMITAASGAVSASMALSVTSWTMQTSGTTSDLYDVVWTGAQYVAVGASGAILTSSDGKKWEQRVSDASNTLYGIAWSGSLLVAVGYPTHISSTNYSIFTSPDGITWTPRISAPYVYLCGIVWSGNKFVAVGWGGTILTSSDGVVWTQQALYTANNLYGIAWSGNKFVAVGAYGTILTSLDGVTWMKQNSSTLNYLSSVSWSGAQFVAVSGQPDSYAVSDYPIHTSPDGITWIDRVADSGMYGALMDIAWFGSQFVSVGIEGAILTSPDGVVWTPWASGTNNYLSAVVWSGSQYVVIGKGGMILTSQ